jgi:hypothetical protein
MFSKIRQLEKTAKKHCINGNEVFIPDEKFKNDKNFSF